MTAIETGQVSAVLSEGAAVRLDSYIAQSGQKETHIYFNPCEDTKSITIADQLVEGMGHTLDIAMTLRDVYPDRRVAVGIAIYEVDDHNEEFSRGFRAVTLPAHSGRCRADVAMPRMRFVLPDDIRLDSEKTCDIRRHFVVRMNSHYVDTSSMCVSAESIPYEPAD